MNAKQSLKAANRTIEALEAQIRDLERINRMHEADTTYLYECIEGTVDGVSICKWCSDYCECQLEAKDAQGCKLWQHVFQQQEGGTGDETMDSGNTPVG